MADYLITFLVRGAEDEADALVTCSERLADGRDFDVEVLDS